MLDVAERVTMTITPVLADQLEAEGVGERMLAFLRRHRVDAADRDVADAGAALRPAAEAEADHYTEAMKRLESSAATRCAPSRRHTRKGRIALMASAATHAVLPKLATLAGRRLQVDAGLRSHERRFGEPAGFWLPECAYVAGLEAVLAERGHRLHLPRPELARAAAPPALTPDRGCPAARSRFTIDWPTVRLVWSDGGYPSDGAYLEYHRLSPERDAALVDLRRRPTTRRPRPSGRREHAASFLAAVRDRLERHRAEQRPPRPLRVRDRHRAARPLVGRGPDLAAARC